MIPGKLSPYLENFAKNVLAIFSKTVYKTGSLMRVLLEVRILKQIRACAEHLFSFIRVIFVVSVCTEPVGMLEK